MKRLSLAKSSLPAALLMLSAAIFTCAQDLRKNARPEQTHASATPNKATDSQPSDPKEIVKYTYEFSQPAFVINRIVIEHDQTGRGTITFGRKDGETPVVEPIQLSPVAANRIFKLWTALNFLESDTNYQSNRHFAHLGVMKIGMQRGDQKRVAEFNWTNNASAAELVAEYRRAADQAILVFDISVARENQPLNAPKLMELFESLLRRNGLSDPQQLLPLLNDLSTDEHIPLIARNHALRLIKKIQKK